MTQLHTRNGKHARSIFRLKLITTPWVSFKPKARKIKKTNMDPKIITIKGNILLNLPK